MRAPPSGNLFEGAEESLGRRALDVLVTNVDADVIARLACTCRGLRAAARSAPQLIFGPSSALWRRGPGGGGGAGAEEGCAGTRRGADAVVTEIFTRHRPGRLQRLVLCPPPVPPRTAPWPRGAAAPRTSHWLAPRTVKFCCDAQTSSLTCVWVEPGVMSPNDEGASSAARGIIPVALDALAVLALRGAGTAIPRAIHRTGLHGASRLRTLALGAAAAMEDAGVRTVLKACPALEVLEITDGAEGLLGRWSPADAAGGADTDGVLIRALAKRLHRLSLSRCPNVEAVALTCPSLAHLSVTDCPEFSRLDLRVAETATTEDMDPLPELAAVVLGGFQGAFQGLGGHKTRRGITRTALLQLVRRCPGLKTLSVPASAMGQAAGEEVEGWTAASVWGEALGTCHLPASSSPAASLTHLALHRPVTTAALRRLIEVAASGAASDGVLPSLRCLFVAVHVVTPGDGWLELAPTEAHAVADDVVALVARCPGLERLTLVHPPWVSPPPPRDPEFGRDWAADAHAGWRSCATGRELSRGALLASCRLARALSPRVVDIDVAADFSGSSAAAWLGVGDAAYHGGEVEEVLEECDRRAPVVWENG